MAETSQWVNRIVGHGEVDPRTLVGHPQNPKVHPAAQDAVVRASLGRAGWVKSVQVNRVTGHVVDGHERVKLAIERGEPVVPVEYIEVAAEDEAGLLLTLDASSALAEPHWEHWAALRAAAEQQEQPAAILDLWSQFAAAGPQAEEGEVEEGADVPDARLADVLERWPVAEGEVWACGRHRVWCGDSCDMGAVAGMLGGITPTMVLADPPYGVQIVSARGYVGGGEAYQIPFGGVKRDTRRRESGGTRVKRRTGRYPIEGARVAGAPTVGKYAPVRGDESAETARTAAAQYLATYPGAVQVWWGGNYYTEVLPASSCWLVWDKETTGNFADCELAWTNQARATRRLVHRWNGMLRASERERRWHPTQKPVALMAWVIEVLGGAGEIILDPFVGSGPTLLAAEQRGHTVVGCERGAAQCSVALERWARLTGQHPRRLEGDCSLHAERV